MLTRLFKLKILKRRGMGGLKGDEKKIESFIVTSESKGFATEIIFKKKSNIYGDI